MSETQPVSFDTASVSRTEPRLAERRAIFSQASKDAGVPLHAIDQVTGGMVPRDFSPEDAQTVTTSLEYAPADSRPNRGSLGRSMATPDGTLVHLHQVVHEESLSPFSDEVVTWIVVGLDEEVGEIELSSGPPDWMKGRNIEVNEFDGPAYEPQYVEQPGRREPKWGY